MVVNETERLIISMKDYYKLSVPGGQLMGGGMSCPFLKIKKKCPDFGKKSYNVFNNVD